MSVEVDSKSTLETAFSVRKIGDFEYEGIKPLTRPSPSARGVFGGNLCAQAVVAARETVDPDYVPHSLHSYFVSAGDDKVPCRYKIEDINTGKTFANRLVKVFQNERLVYMVMVSLTKRNSVKKVAEAYEKTGKGPSPFEYQLPPGGEFDKYNPEDLPPMGRMGGFIEHRLTPEFYDINEAEELKKSPGERELSFYVRILDQPKQSATFRYTGLALISDSLYLATVSRLLHLPGDNTKPLTPGGGMGTNFFSLSLDHTIYFHDDDFDPSQWLFFRYSSPRMVNNRVLFHGGYYNQKGKLIASVSQEGLVFFKDGIEAKAKL